MSDAIFEWKLVICRDEMALACLRQYFLFFICIMNMLSHIRYTKFSFVSSLYNFLGSKTVRVLYRRASPLYVYGAYCCEKTFISFLTVSLI